MEENNSKETEGNNSKEINLLQLISLFLNWLSKLVKNLFNFFGYLIKLCFRRWLIVIIIISLCFLYGQFLARPSARSYKAEAMAILYGSDTQTAKEVFKQLENTLSSNNLISLATKLSLPDSVANNILEVRSFYVIDYLDDGVADVIDFKNTHSNTDTLNLRMQNQIYIRLVTRNINQVPQVQVALLRYLNNNEMMKSKFEAKKNVFLQSISICDREMLRIDSLAKVTYFKEYDKQLKFDNNTLLIGKQDKQLFYTDLLRLQEIKSNAEMQLAEYKQPMELPSGFVVNPNPLNGRTKYGLLSILIGFALSIVVSLLLENTKNISVYLKK